MIRPIRCLLIVVMLCAPAADALAATRKKADPKPDNAVSFDFEYENFGSAYSPWKLAWVEVQHRFDFGPVIGRVNRARRFGQSGTQLEVDAYPRISPTMYLYANAGVSGDDIFPRQRLGLELYKNLPNGYEASAGLRQLNFKSAHVTLFTGTVAKYLGNNYYMFRPYLSSRSGGTSTSAQFEVKTYFATADDNAAIIATYGKAPTEDIAPDAVNRLTSWNVRATAQKVLIRNLIFNARVGYRDEQIRQTAHRRGWMVGAGIQHRF